MATRRDVTIGVDVETSGDEGLRRTSDALRGIGDAADGAAPSLDRLSRELDAAAAATTAKRATEQAARADAAAARAELNAQADALARLRAAADATARATEDHRARETALRVAVTELRIALRDKQAALTAAAADARTAAAAERDLRSQIEATARAQVTGNTAIGQSVDALKGQLSTLRNLATAAVGGTMVGALAKDLAATADAYSNLGARVKLVTGEGDAFKVAFDGVQQVAQRTGATLESIGTLFARVAAAGREFGLAQRDALALTETITQAVQLSGTSAQSSEAAITQLIQGLQSGVLRGEEFNSVMEQAPRLAQALAAGLGVAVGELRKLAEQGTLTSQTVVQALQGQSQAIQREFDTMPPTVERAIGRLSAAWQVYIGEASKGSGATASAASAIETLARHLDTLGALLYSAGKAGLAFTAVRLAAAFVETASAATAAATATTAATAATVAHTTATRASAAAQVEAAAATAGTAANAGRLAGILATVKLAALAVVVTNLREIGTAIGEGLARWVGYGKAIDEVEAAHKREEEASRRNAAAKAALAQATQQATDKALGLTAESKKLVAEFDGVIAKGDSATDALGKLTKALRLDDLSGITAAGAALDALGQRGKLSADQIRGAMAEALKGDDLGRFDAMARAAFDGSEQGARRLKAALDAVADESLRRAGTSAAELRTGFGAAMSAALNDVDALDRTLRALGVTGTEAGRLLSGAMDKALATANTQRAVQELIGRWELLGKQGRVTGDMLADGLEKARKKLDDLRPGVNTLAEAFRTLGLSSREELTRTAEKAGEAYRLIVNSGQASIGQQIEAFAKWRTAALAASGGVVTEQIRVGEVMMETRARAAGLGDAFDKAMGKGSEATRRMRADLSDLGSEVAGVVGQLDSMSAAAAKARNAASQSVLNNGGSRFDDQGWSKDMAGNRVNMELPTVSGIIETLKGFGLTDAQAAGLAREFTDGNGGIPYFNNAGQLRYGGKDSTLSQALARAAQLVKQGVISPGMQWGGTTPGAGFGDGGAKSGALGGSTSHTVTVSIGGKSTTVNTASAGDAQTLADIFRQLETAAGAAGGGGGG